VFDGVLRIDGGLLGDLGFLLRFSS
jgi:hypothetical protein